MASNSIDETLAALSATLERIASAAREAEIEAEVQRRLAEERAAAAAVPRRSQLTAKQKSDIIFEKGKNFYDLLPWE
jgi:hypothetical protein